MSDIEVYSASHSTKNCLNCGHRRGRGSYSECMKSGHYCSTQRKYPNRACNIDFSGWEPRKPNIFTRLILWIAR